MVDDTFHVGGRAASGQGEDVDRSLLAAEYLRGHDLQKILAGLVRDDPLGIGPKTLERLERSGYLLDSERLMARVFGRVAHDADLYDETEEEFDGWLDERVDSSIQQLVRQDWEEERAGTPPEPNDLRYQFLTERIGLDAGLCRRASIAINELDEPTRVAFTSVVVYGRTLDECTRAGLGTLDELRVRIRAATQAISRIVGDDAGGTAP